MSSLWNAVHSDGFGSRGLIRGHARQSSGCRAALAGSGARYGSCTQRVVEGCSAVGSALRSRRAGLGSRLDYLPYDKRVALGVFTADERAEQVAGSYTTPAEETSVEPDVDVETLSQSAPVESPVTPISATPIGSAPAPKTAHSSAELLEIITGKASDAPLCMTCGIKMRPAGSCYVCEGCGSTSGCS